MSVRVPLAELDDQIAVFGPYAYLLTVGDDRRPRATSATVGGEGRELVVGVGRRTASNVERNDQVTLLWPAAQPSGYALLADGFGRVEERADGTLALRIQPVSAVLHVTAPARS
ncbi:MAG: pyridoxamine 5'-phosphate oxidase family protein [Vicinamibacteria bacterium]